MNPVNPGVIPAKAGEEQASGLRLEAVGLFGIFVFGRTGIPACFKQRTKTFLFLNRQGCLFYQFFLVTPAAMCVPPVVLWWRRHLACVKQKALPFPLSRALIRPSATFSHPSDGRRNKVLSLFGWIPAFAGMTAGFSEFSTLPDVSFSG